MNDVASVYEDEIDLREITRTLWKARWLILSLTLILALVGFAVSAWFLPKQYRATAYVFIGRPVVDFKEAVDFSGLAISPTLPDLKAVALLAAAPGVLESVLKDPSVVAAFGNKEISISSMAGKTVARDLGKDQLSLQVNDTDPQRAALIANTWAKKVTDTVNATYGLDIISDTLDSQVLLSQDDYEQAQAALEEAVSKSQANTLNAQLERKKADLNSVLASLARTMSVLDDLYIFEKGLSGVPGESPLSLGDGLVLTTLRQRALTVPSDNIILQVDSAAFTGFTVSKALAATTQMRAALKTQLINLKNEQTSLEKEIPQLQSDFIKANAQIDQLTTQRDRTQGIFALLKSRQQIITTVLRQSSKVATVSVEAVNQGKEVSPNKLLNSAAAGITGLLISAFWALAAAWWKNSN